MLNEAIAFFRPGKDVTAVATANLVGMRLCAISGNRTGGPGLSTDLQNGYRVGLPTAGGKVLGVVGYDVPSGSIVPVKREGILPVMTGGIIAADAEVEVTATGTIITASGTAGRYIIGRVLTGAGSGTIAELELYIGSRVQ